MQAETESCLEYVLKLSDGCSRSYVQLIGHDKAQGVDHERHSGALLDAEVTGF